MENMYKFNQDLYQQEISANQTSNSQRKTNSSQQQRISNLVFNEENSFIKKMEEQLTSIVSHHAEENENENENENEDEDQKNNENNIPDEKPQTQKPEKYFEMQENNKVVFFLRSQYSFTLIPANQTKIIEFDINNDSSELAFIYSMIDNNGELAIKLKVIKNIKNSNNNLDTVIDLNDEDQINLSKKKFEMIDESYDHIQLLYIKIQEQEQIVINNLSGDDKEYWAYRGQAKQLKRIGEQSSILGSQGVYVTVTETKTYKSFICLIHRNGHIYLLPESKLKIDRSFTVRNEQNSVQIQIGGSQLMSLKEIDSTHDEFNLLKGVYFKK